MELAIYLTSVGGWTESGGVIVLRVLTAPVVWRVIGSTSLPVLPLPALLSRPALMSVRIARLLGGTAARLLMATFVRASSRSQCGSSVSRVPSLATSVLTLSVSAPWIT